MSGPGASSAPRVAVVGGGLAGSVAAWHLAAAGLAPVLFDREAEPGARAACGGVALAALAPELELGDEVVDHWLRQVLIVAGARRRRLELRRPIFISFDRGDLDATLAARAVAAGAELRRRCRVTAWNPDGGRLTWTHDGREHEEAFATVVLADGWKTVGWAAGLGVAPDVTTATAFYRELADGGSPPTAAAEFYFDLAADDPGYYWVFPKRDGVQVGVGRVELGRGRPLRELLDEFIARDPRLVGLERCCAHGGVLPLELARRTARPGALVVGDAAGLVNPITGGGLIYAVASGEMAARAVIEGAERGRDAAWVARRYDRLLHRSPHYWYLRLQALPFRLYLERVRAGRPFPFTAMFLFFASVMPRLEPAARLVTELRSRRHVVRR